MKQFDLDEYLANPSRKVVTRDGKSARIVCTNRVAQEYKLVALVMKDGTESVCVYNTDGCVYKNETHALDLFFAPERKEGWVNIYKAAAPRNTLGCMVTRYVGSSIWPTEEAAKTAADADSVITIKIEWEE